MAITTMDQLVSAIASASFQATEESSITSKGAGYFASLWQAAGRPGSGATPATGAGAAPTNATAGAIPYTNPGGANIGYLAKLLASSSNAETLILYDRLVHTSGLSGTVTTAQTVNSTALTRYTAGTDVGLWLEWYTATGSTAVNVTASYTNQAGTSGQTTVSTALPASCPAGFTIPLPLAAGDTGVRSVQSVTLSGTTGTAGNFGVTLGQRIASLPLILANVGVTFDWSQVGLPQIANNACLAWHVLCTTTSTGTILSEFCFAQG